VVERDSAGGEIGERLGHQGTSEAEKCGVGNRQGPGTHRFEQRGDGVRGGAGLERVEVVVEQAARAQLAGRPVGLEAAAAAHQVDRHA
jgi:hypothetical protein